MHKLRGSLIYKNGGVENTDKRPRGMWRRTYERITSRMDKLYWKSSMALYLRYADIRNDEAFQDIFEPTRQRAQRV
jgi:hypothetical protein